jgi:hypothetical protein
MEWQPIESVPEQDDSMDPKIDLWVQWSGGAFRFCDVYYAKHAVDPSDRTWWGSARGNWRRLASDETVTHWMTIPPAPEAK